MGWTPGNNDGERRGTGLVAGERLRGALCRLQQAGSEADSLLRRPEGAIPSAGGRWLVFHDEADVPLSRKR